MYHGIAGDGFVRTVLKNVSRVCPRCGAALRFAYRRKRHVILLRERLALEVDVDRCSESTCPLHAGFAPPEEGRLALPKFIYGLEVLTEIARLRWVLRQTLPEMHATLRTTYDLPIAERSVDYAMQTWQDLATASVLRDRRRIAALKAQGGIILGIDGLQPEKGHETLYLLRDTLSGTNLLTRSLTNSSAAHLVPLIDAVKAMGVPILGVVTDKQHSLILAVAEALPDTPHQLCHFHFLRNLAQPLTEADRAMKKRIKKTLRGIAPVERSLVARADAPDVAQAAAYCVALRATLTDAGTPPLDPGGLKMLGRLRQLDQSLATSREKGGSSPWSVFGG